MSLASARVMKPEGPGVLFNPEQWAEEHEKLDAERFSTVNKSLGSIWKVLGVAGVTIIGLLGWSLQAQYDSAKTQLAATAQVQQMVSNLAK